MPLNRQAFLFRGDPLCTADRRFRSLNRRGRPRQAQLSALPEERDPGKARPGDGGARRAARARVRLPPRWRAQRWKVHEPRTARSFPGCDSATPPGDRLCRLLLALARRHWRLHHPARDAHRVLACNCHRARAPSAANCISRGCGRLPAPWGWAVAGWAAGERLLSTALGSQRAERRWSQTRGGCSRATASTLARLALESARAEDGIELFHPDDRLCTIA